MAGLLVAYLNIQGAWLVAGALAATGFYFASAVTIWALRDGIEDRWIHAQSWHDRWRNWREERAEIKAQKRAERVARQQNARPARPHGFVSGLAPEPGPEEFVQRPSRLAALLGRRARAPEADPLDEIPAYRRAPLQADENEVPIAEKPRKTSIWERSVGEPAPDQVEPAAAEVSAPPIQHQPQSIGARPSESIPAPRPEPLPGPRTAPAPAPRFASEIAIHERADADVRTATVAPKNVSGFKLPPSTLLNAGEGPQAIREDVLREEAKVLVEKCGEFDVRGQVVQINPGPMVTTYEFKPEAGVKYSRVTGLADDLCLAMRAESILIERMAGKSTVGIQVPNHERETIHLRDVIESEPFHKAKSRLTLAMGKDINGRIVTADLAPCRTCSSPAPRARANRWPSTP